MIELVLLGHRLLRQAEVGEGAVAVFVEDDPRDAALSKLEQVREPFFDLDSTRPAAPADAPGHEHTSTVKLAVLVNLHGAEVLPLVKPPTPRRGHPGDALGAVGIELDVPDELDVDVRPIDSTEIPAFPVRVDRAHEGQVLGHRLLLQPRRFEGLAWIVEPCKARDLPITNVEDVPAVGFDGHLVSPAPRSHSCSHRDSVFRVVDLNRRDLVVAVDVEYRVGGSSELRVAPPRTRLDRIWRVHPLDLRVHQRGHDAESIPLPRRVQGPHELHVLLGHRLLLQADGFEGLLRVEVRFRRDDPAILEGPDHGGSLLGRQAASCTAPASALDDDDVITSVDQALRLDGEFLPYGANLASEPSQSLVSDVDVWVEDAAGHIDSHVGGEPPEQLALRVSVAAGGDLTEKAHYLAHDLHVLLRHRLLRQAEVGEGSVSVPIDDDLANVSPANSENGCCPAPRLRDLQSARLAAPAQADRHEDALIVELAIVPCLHAVVLPCSLEFTPVVCQRSNTPQGAGVGAVHDDELHLWMCPVGRGEVVAAFPRGVDRAHEVQVLRHRLLLEPHGFEGFTPRKKCLDRHKPAIARHKTHGELLIQLDVAGSAPHSYASEPQHRLAEVPNLGLLKVELLPRLPHRLEPLSHLVVTSIDDALNGGGTSRHPFDVWGGVAEPHRSVTLIPGCDALVDDLHVLLRHRLLLQAHGFEGLVAVQEDSDAVDLALDEVVDVCGCGILRDATRSAARGDLQEGEDLTRANRFHAFSVYPEVGCCILDIDQKPFDAIGTFVHAGDLGQRRPQHDILGTAREIAVDVPRVYRRDCPRDHLNVLLRHRLLLQACCSQGLAVIEICSDTRDLAAAKFDDGPLRCLDWDAAASPAPLKPTKNEDAVAEIAKLLADQVQLLPGVAHHREVARQALTAPVTAPIDRSDQGREELVARDTKLVNHVEIAPVERVIPPLGDLHVLLGHRLLRQAHGFEDLAHRRTGASEREPHDLPVGELVDLRSMDVDAKSAAFAFAKPAGGHENEVTLIDEPLDLGREAVECSEPLFEGAAQRGSPDSCLGRQDRFPDVEPLDVRVDSDERTREIPPAPTLVGASDDLHVLLRHRLLREAEVGECALALRVETQARHLGSAYVDHVYERGLDVHATCLPAPVHPSEHEHAPALKLPIFVGFGAVVVPCGQPPSPSLGHACDSLPAARVWAAHDLELDLGVRPLGRVECAATPRRVDRAHKVQVLGHRLPLQADGLEGLLPREVGVYACDLPVAQLDVPSDLMLHPVVAPLDPHALMDQGDDVVASVDRRLQVQPELVEVLGPPRCGRSQSVWALISTILRPLRRRKPLDTRVDVVQDAVNSGAVERLKGLTHDLHVLLGHRLPPFLGEAFGGSSALLGLGIAGPVYEQPSVPHADPCLPRPNASAAPGGTSILADDRKDNPVTQINGLLELELQVVKGSVVVLPEATDRPSPLEYPQPPGRHVKHGIGAVDAHLRVKITPAIGLHRPAHLPERVGGRGLLRHHPASIPHHSSVIASCWVGTPATGPRSEHGRTRPQEWSPSLRLRSAPDRSNVRLWFRGTWRRSPVSL